MLRYESVARVGVSDARVIRAEAAALDRDWWRRPLGFEGEEEEHPATLYGRTSLFYRTRSISDADDLFMAFSDAAFIVERLAGWSERFNVKWRVRMHDEDWGAVDPGGPTKPLLEQLRRWAGRVGVFVPGGTWSVPEARRAELLARHAGRIR